MTPKRKSAVVGGAIGAVAVALAITAAMYFR